MPLNTSDIPTLCLRWSNGNEDAAAFLVNWSNVVRIADDVADGDSQNPVGDIASVLIRCLNINARNPFFQSNCSVLSFTMSEAVLLWQKSEDWRRSSDRKTRMFAFIAREAVEHVAHVVAMITGGYDHALRVAEEIQFLSHQTSPETFEEWEAG